MLSARATAAGCTDAKHTLLPTEEPPEDEAPHPALRAVPDGSQRALRCCWENDGAGSGAGLATSVGPGSCSSQCWCTSSFCLHPGPSGEGSLINKERLVMAGGTVLWVVVGLCAYTSNEVVHDAEGGSLTYCQAIYLMSQIITTVGYGDITPKSDLGMLFSTFYILVSALLFSGIIMELIDYVVDKQQSHVDNALSQMLDGQAVSQSFLQRHVTLLMASLFFSLCAFVWMLFFMFYCDQAGGVCEGLTFVQAFYFAIVTMCGVGFGDIVPRTQAGELFAAGASVLGIVTYLNLVGAISDSMLKAKKNAHITTLSESQFTAADLSNDGTVDLYEFTRFILTKFNMVSADVLDDIRHNFSELDANGSGDITLDDISDMLQYKSRGKTKTSPKTSP